MARVVVRRTRSGRAATRESPARRLGRRFLGRLALLAGVLALVFAAVDMLPGSAAKGVLGANATDDAVHAKNLELGLDRAWPIRFLRWLGGLLSGDMGTSIRGRRVGELVAAALPETMILVGAAVLVAVPCSVALGAWWATSAGRRARRSADALTTTAIAVPEFVIATMLVVLFALLLDALPAATIVTADGSIAAPDMRVLPALALVIPQIGWNGRVVHAAVADHVGDPHVTQAILDGVPPRRVLLHHVLPMALPTIAASAATSTGMLVGGAVVVETAFNHPGIGNLLSSAVAAKDSVTAAAIVAVVGILIACVLTASDAVRVAVTGRAA
ncbi:ABC transporter permease [Corynebacterium hansenii]|uniref:ABC transporter permease n=1 Tax=Corynebacterium hansenii TaxID=394964 RepID=A0ABV7ZL45_9CORY|nr:ABC transporter permease [Corynebacterium hansenii]WJY98911.1 Glutathione transport system permease protein GsiC [Corynebacterium hansenii]